jgi:hypothetical protein
VEGGSLEGVVEELGAWKQSVACCRFGVVALESILEEIGVFSDLVVFGCLGV